MQKKFIFSNLEKNNIAIAVSFPHFYGADVLVQSMFPRIKPNATFDQSFLDIEPV